MPYIDPQDKKMYMVVIFGAGMFALPMIGGALPIIGVVTFPLAALCAVGFVLTWFSPAERLFPFRTLPRRIAPVLWSYTAYAAKAILFFGGISLVLYLIFRALD